MKPYCPHCRSEMSRAGSVSWIPGEIWQQFRCTNKECLKRTIRPLDDKGNKLEAQIYKGGK